VEDNSIRARIPSSKHRSNMWYWLQCHWCSVVKLSISILLKLQVHISDLFPLSVGYSTAISLLLRSLGMTQGVPAVREDHPPRLRWRW